MYSAVHAQGLQAEGKSGDESSFSIHPDGAHFRLRIQYDGTHFHGWQSQGEEQNVRTVQNMIEEALTHLNRGDPVRVTAAGRTDKGDLVKDLCMWFMYVYFTAGG